MKIYFAGDGYDKYIYEEENVLKSYFYLSKTKPLRFSTILLDSGGFSAFTRKENIDIDAYISYIKRNNSSLQGYFVLDDITNWQGTLNNQKYMEAQGLSPIPCWHAGEPRSVLHQYCKKYCYVSLGGLVPHAKYYKRITSILDDAFSVIKKYPHVKIHGFGMTAKRILERYPFYSVDSSSWLTGARTGRIQKWDKTECGLDSFRLMDKGPQKLYIERVIYMKGEVKKLEKYITALWKKRGVVWDD